MSNQRQRDEFELIAVQATGVRRGYWKISRHGPWLYLFDAYEAQDGEIKTAKSRSGKPFMMRIHSENYANFLKFLQRVKKILEEEPSTPTEDDIPF